MNVKKLTYQFGNNVKMLNLTFWCWINTEQLICELWIKLEMLNNGETGVLSIILCIFTENAKNIENQHFNVVSKLKSYFIELKSSLKRWI